MVQGLPERDAMNYKAKSASPDNSSDNNLYGSSKETSPQSLEKNSGTRGRYSKINSSLSTKASSEKLVINIKKQNSKPEVSSDPMDFKIKTLDEIRREKGIKKGNKEDSSNSSTNTTVKDRIPSQDSGQKPTKRLKLTRKPTESYQSNQSTLNKEKDKVSVLSYSSLKTESKPQTTLHEVQANNLTKSNESSTIKTTVTVARGKRKPTEDAELESKSKVPKQELMIKSSVPNGINAIEKQAAKGLRPFLRRQPLSKSSTNASKPVDSSTVSSVITEAGDNSSAEPMVAEGVTTYEDVSISSTTAENNYEMPSTPMEEEKSRSKSLSVDDFDNFLIEADMNIEGVDCTESAGGDDILLEIEQFLDS